MQVAVSVPEAIAEAPMESISENGLAAVEEAPATGKPVKGKKGKKDGDVRAKPLSPLPRPSLAVSPSLTRLRLRSMRAQGESDRALKKGKSKLFGKKK